MEGRKSDPPGAVSDQNQEEAESLLRDDQQHPEPRTRGDDADGTRDESRKRPHPSGNPDSAG